MPVKWKKNFCWMPTHSSLHASIVEKYGEVLRFLQDSPLYSDKALRIWSDVNVADPWLIATASALGYTLVTFETSAGIISVNNPSRKPKIPDIARKFDVKCENLFYFMRDRKSVV